MKKLSRISKAGPHGTGVRRVEMADPFRADRRLPLDIWYPAELDSEQIATGPDATHPFRAEHAAHVDARPAPGRHPMILFSHGNSGMSRQSTFLTTHLASWGFVVAAPDHTGNTFEEMLQIESQEERKRVHLEARENRPRDITATADFVLEESKSGIRVDPERIGMLGHSYGGWTSLKMPGHDARVRAVCGLAPASEPFVGRKAFDEGELPFSPTLPVLLIAGIEDVLVDLETSVRPLFDRLAHPRGLIGIERSDHFHFCDSISLLHHLHEKNPRPNQPRPTSPLADLLPEERMHAIVRSIVTRFFLGALNPGEGDALDGLGDRQLSELDPAVRRLD